MTSLRRSGALSLWSVSSPPLGSRASVPAAARGRTPIMAPKRAQARAKPVARRGAAAKRAAQVTTSNVRKKARRDACTALHTLAAEFAVPGLSADARRQACNTETERLARVLQGRCQAPEAAARLRANNDVEGVGLRDLPWRQPSAGRTRRVERHAATCAPCPSHHSLSRDGCEQRLVRARGAMYLLQGA
jgi:hypothetical protein